MSPPREFAPHLEWIGVSSDASDPLLDALRAEGDFDSHGSLTIDPLRAREVLGHARLERPEAWVLQLVAAAVTAGATRLLIDGECGAWEAEYDAATPLGGSLGGDRDLGAGAMAVAVGALLDEGRTVTVEVTEGGRRRTVRFEAGAQQVDDGAGEGTRTRFVVSGGTVGERLRRLLPGTSPSAEEDLLVERCAYAPLQLVVNGRACSRTVSAGGLASRVLRDRDGRARLPLFLASDAREVEGFSAILTLRLPAEGEPPGWSGWGVLVDGVLYPLDEGPWRHVHCLASAPDLALDLSLASVRRDERLRELLESLRAEALDMILEATGDPERLRALGKEALRRLVDTLLDAEKPYTDLAEAEGRHRLAEPRLHRLVACRAVVCALHGAPLVGGGVDTVRVLSRLPAFELARHGVMLDAACQALGRLFLKSCYGDGDAWPLSEVGEHEGKRDELFELWRTLAPSHACRRAHLRLALDAVVRGQLEEAWTRVQQAVTLLPGPDGWTAVVAELVKRAREGRPDRVTSPEVDTFVGAVCDLVNGDAAPDADEARRLYGQALSGFRKHRNWWGRVWADAAQASLQDGAPARGCGEAALLHLRRLALEGPAITVDP